MVIVLFLILVLFLLIFKLGSAALQVREQKGWKILRILFTFEGEKKERDKYIDAGRSPTLFKWRCGFWFGGSGDREAPSIEEGGVVCNMAWHSLTMLPGPCSLFFQTCRAISQGCAPVLLSQTATTRPTKRDTVRTRAQYNAHAHSITATTLPTLLEQCNCVFSGTSPLLCACWFFHGQRRYVSVLVVDVFY